MRRAPQRPGRQARCGPAGLLLVSVFLLPGEAPARERPTYFERDYETAEKLNELYERLEDADLLVALDFADGAIVAFGCRDEDRAYSDALAEVKMLGQRKRAGERLTHDEERRYAEQLEAEKRLWREFEDCYTEQLGQPSVAGDLPPEIDSHAAAVATYDRLREKHGWQRDGGFDAVAADVQEKIEELESKPPYIATAVSVFGQVEVVRGGRARPLRREEKLLPGDVIRTSPGARVRIELHDRIETKHAGPTVLNVGSSSEFAMEKFLVRFQQGEEEGWLETVVGIVQGRIRAFTRGFVERSAFTVRTSASHCSLRGGDAEIEHRPELDETTFTVREGVAEITAPGGKVILRPGRTLTVRDGAPGPVRALEELPTDGPPT